MEIPTLAMLLREISDKSISSTISAVTQAAAMEIHFEQLYELVKNLDETEFDHNPEPVGEPPVWQVVYRVVSRRDVFTIKLALSPQSVVILSFSKKGEA